MARVAYLLVIASALLVNPQNTSAQASPSAPTATTPAAAKSEAAKPEAAKSEEDENNVFRHSAMTQTIARWFNTDVETAARGAEIFNFLIIIFGIGIPLFRILPKTIKNRRVALAKNIEDARTVTVEAQARMSAVESKLQNLDAEIQKFRTEVESESKGDEARIKASIEEEKARIVAAAQQEIQQVTAQAERQLKQYAANLAFERAISQMKLSEETDKELINDFIKDVTETIGGKR
jgi:F-type H+-transporting ATPase subunit b